MQNYNNLEIKKRLKVLDANIEAVFKYQTLTDCSRKYKNLSKDLKLTYKSYLNYAKTFIEYEKKISTIDDNNNSEEQIEAIKKRLKIELNLSLIQHL